MKRYKVNLLLLNNDIFQIEVNANSNKESILNAITEFNNKPNDIRKYFCDVALTGHKAIKIK